VRVDIASDFEGDRFISLHTFFKCGIFLAHGVLEAVSWQELRSIDLVQFSKPSLRERFEVG
jgi:hypothetical protein